MILNDICIRKSIFHAKATYITLTHLKKEVKVNIQMSVCLTKHHTMKTYGQVEVQFHTFLTLALDGGEWSDSCTSHFNPRERAPDTHWIVGWVGPRASLDAMEKEPKFKKPNNGYYIFLHY
jgi:hypothetical protein